LVKKACQSTGSARKNLSRHRLRKRFRPGKKKSFQREAAGKAVSRPVQVGTVLDQRRVLRRGGSATPRGKNICRLRGIWTAGGGGEFARGKKTLSKGKQKKGGGCQKSLLKGDISSKGSEKKEIPFLRECYLISKETLGTQISYDTYTMGRISAHPHFQKRF